MIEQRIGKPAATAVLYAVTAGAFAWGIHALFAYLVQPISTHGENLWAYVRSITPPQLIEISVQAVISGTVVVLIFIAGLKVIEKRLKRKANELTGVLRGQMIETRTIVEECRAFTTENHRELREASDKLKRDIEKAQKTLEIIEELEREYAAKYLLASRPQN